MKQYIYITLYISAITIGQVYGMELIPAKQNDFIKDKLVNKKSYSIEDWKKYQFLLMDSRGFIDNPCERKKRTQMIKKTRKIITLKEREIDLKAVVSYIRQTKIADIDDLRAYKTKL